MHQINMKQTEKWLPIAQKKAQSELTEARCLIRTIDRFRVFDKDEDLLNERRRLSTKIRDIRFYLKVERFKAIQRGDLSATEYRPNPRKKEPFLSVVIPEPLPEITSPILQRILLMVG
jgi:hypothetical protein